MIVDAATGPLTRMLMRTNSAAIEADRRPERPSRSRALQSSHATPGQAASSAAPRPVEPLFVVFVDRDDDAPSCANDAAVDAADALAAAYQSPH